MPTHRFSGLQFHRRRQRQREVDVKPGGLLAGTDRLHFHRIFCLHPLRLPDRIAPCQRHCDPLYEPAHPHHPSAPLCHPHAGVPCPRGSLPAFCPRDFPPAAPSPPGPVEKGSTHSLGRTPQASVPAIGASVRTDTCSARFTQARIRAPLASGSPESGCAADRRLRTGRIPRSGKPAVRW